MPSSQHPRSAPSSQGLDFLHGPTLLELPLQVSNHFIHRVEWAVERSLHGFREFGVDGHALRRRVFVVCVGEFGEDRDDAAGGLHFEFLSALKTRTPESRWRNDDGWFVFDRDSHGI